MGNALLVLANGMVFSGRNFGATGTSVGEVVFNTGMVGYEETLTDPSYYGQIITQTYPLVGNYGINGEDAESARVWAFGYIVREHCEAPSNFRCKKTLDTYLKEQNVIGIEDIDTRQLTKVIRESGVMNGALTTEYENAAAALRDESLMAKIKAYAVTNAVNSVTTDKISVVNEGGKRHVVLLDYGCKRSIIRSLVQRGCKVSEVPACTTAAQIKELKPDGIVLSNGPGDPAKATQEIENLKDIAALGKPIFGICLGHQLLALAMGAKTEKLKCGHHGSNLPVTDFAHDRTYVTAQNHGYAVVAASVPEAEASVSHVNANDGTTEGIRYKNMPCFTVQFHPEACGSSRDNAHLFDEFVTMMNGEC